MCKHETFEKFFSRVKMYFYTFYVLSQAQPNAAPKMALFSELVTYSVYV